VDILEAKPRKLFSEAAADDTLPALQWVGAVRGVRPPPEADVDDDLLVSGSEHGDVRDEALQSADAARAGLWAARPGSSGEPARRFASHKSGIV